MVSDARCRRAILPIAGLVAAIALAADGRDQIAPGTLLVASPGLTDPRFAHTVVLLFHHDETGTLGVILNRPTGIDLATWVPELPEGRTDQLWFGGPVAPELSFALARERTDLPGRIVAPGCRLLEGPEGLEAAWAHDVPSADLRVFSGHAGWAPGQLAGEIRAGGWLLLPAAPRWIFPSDPAALWDELVHAAANPIA